MIIVVITGPKTTARQLERTVASLRGLLIDQVDYVVPTGGPDGLEPAEWDLRQGHEPTFGCQFTTHLGVVFTLIWNDSFDGYGIEVFDQPIETFPTRPGNSGFPALISVTDHPRWSGLLHREILHTELAWVEWGSGGATPVWIRLDFAPVRHDQGDPHRSDSVWLVAGRWAQGRFTIPADDLTVMFDESEAVRANLVRPRPASVNR
ncbi:hypothetical protein ACFWNL_06000 [Kitasatospora sp. NPDC058397]|uniref:hypothetical protein n=1 Tax=unclassified Kitasatospora TaxID=2633591 RepID=UPI00366273E4